MQKIQSYKALVVDDHKMFAETLRDFLKKMGQFSVVDECSSIEDAGQKMLQHTYDYLFTALIIPGSDVQEFIENSSKFNTGLNIIVVSSVTDPFVIKELFGKGIHAFLSKSASTNEIKAALEAISSGEKYISTNLVGKLATAMYIIDHNNLTPKEIEVIRLVAKGLTIVEAAQVMQLSSHTIVGHRRNIMQKLGIRSATEIVKYAFENKLC
jgi:DNA-binding NarL/FixJ family response regulator